ncbi:MAG: sigma-54 interaction domain-containing protein [Phycisphaerales bacterium]
MLSVLASLGCGIVLCDTGWRSAWANPLACDLLGASEDALRGEPLSARLLGIDVLPAESAALGAGVGNGGEGGAGGAVLRGVPVSRSDRGLSVDVVVGTVGNQVGDELARLLAANQPARVSTDAPSPSVGPIRRCLTLIDASMRVGAEAEAARLRAALADSERARAKVAALEEERSADETAGYEMVGTSPGLERVRAQVARVAPTDTTVLIHGETGSGKELVARSVHAHSKRKGRAFIAVNCAALPESLIESELFGHEKGAFTGADKRRLGKFELADGGTLFLDEVAEMPLPAQAKLLRVIQEGSLERVGGVETVRVNVRLLAATHRDLARQVERGRFREDLFYRLNVFRIDVPPLRDRKEDLRTLAEHLHERVAKRMARLPLPMSDTSLRRIMAYPWPGNVRELANAVERATLLADGPQLEIELPESPLIDLPGRGGGSGGVGSAAGGGGVGAGGTRGGAAAATRDILLDLSLEQLQRLQITHALESCGYRVFGPGGAAERLDINPNTLLARMDKYGIPRPRLMKRSRRGG